VATVLVALTQARASVEVLRGENGGRSLAHTAVVRDLVSTGSVGSEGGDLRATLHLSTRSAQEPFRVVAFAQRQRNHEIVGAATRDVAASGR
jgi:hypothetical protein